MRFRVFSELQKNNLKRLKQLSRVQNRTLCGTVDRGAVPGRLDVASPASLIYMSQALQGVEDMRAQLAPYSEVLLRKPPR